MMKLILPFIVLAFSVNAKADIIKCMFTEPFITTVYSMAEQSLTYINPLGENGNEERTTEKNVSFQIKKAGVFDLVSKDGKVLQTLKLNNQGSDGMSNAIYPYDVKDNSQLLAPTMGRGGCSSNYLKAKD